MESNNNYVDNAELMKHLADYKKRKNLDPNAQIDDYTARCLMAIAEGFSQRRNFRNYSFRDEMVSDAIENMLTYISNFDPEKSSNPFSYFSQISYFSFIRRISREKTQTYVRFKSIQKRFLNNNLADLQEADHSEEGFDFSVDDPLYQNMHDFIDEYEEGIRESKRKIQRRKDKQKDGEEENDGVDMKPKTRYNGPVLSFE